MKARDREILDSKTGKFVVKGCIEMSKRNVGSCGADILRIHRISSRYLSTLTSRDGKF